MTISFYDVSVASYLQTLEAVGGYLDKAQAHCEQHGYDPEQIVETRIFLDMRPFRYQIQAVAHHSLGAIEGIKTGVFQPPGARPQHDFAGLKALIADTRAEVAKVTREEIDGRVGAEVMFQVKDSQRRFTAEDFVLSFSLPNFHFHAATGYNILRSVGIPVGKRDFMGTLRLKA
ncbi:DUF1993 domain-containing protein [Oxalobacteraceae bacterium CAVE-383]|nr:DUF1993 domain-containing protein [Oxalobacteraceae bacterium CAVE-383]